MSFEVEMPVIEKVCWCDYSMAMRELARKVKSNKVMSIKEAVLTHTDNEKGKPEQIVALGRGGLIPGVQLSHLLDIPLVPLMWQTRDGAVNEKFTTDKYSLIVDDINDSGRTLTEVTTQNVFENSYSVAVLYQKWSSSFKDVAFYGEIADSDVWYVFPWEKK